MVALNFLRIYFQNTIPQNTVALINKQSAFASVYTLQLAWTVMLVLALVSLVEVPAVAQLGVCRLILLYIECLLKLIACSDIRAYVF